ncbi:gustatory receptor 68a-like [Tribolium madens]|uniref:gustatory receptor 68a-like n=1 Tax=Tribolium madens TaxID=41895 RepID=UPI001CF7451A|nr:gustatory receptor 68a-like [Tribolium madens]
MPQVRLYKHYFPVILWSKILGISPISYKGSRITYSKIGTVQTITYFVIFIILTIAFFEERSSLTTPIELIDIRTIRFVATFRTVANITLMAVLFLGTYMRREKFLTSLKQIQNLEPEFHKLNQIGTITRNNRQTRRMVVLLIVLSMSFNFFGDFLTFFMKEKLDLLWREFCTFVVIVYPRLVVNNINLGFLTLLMILEGRFKVINDVLKSLINDSRKMNKFPVELNFCDKIKHLVNLHKSLVKVAKDHNSLYSLHLLLWITVTFILLVGDSYIVMYILFFHLSDVRYILILYLVKNVVMYGIELFVLAKIVTNLCQEANNTKKLIVKIKIDIDKENERNELISSALKLSQSDLEITACKFFSIDNALLFSICGASSSYLFIMIQLDLGNKKNENGTILMDFNNLTFNQSGFF